MERPYYGWVIVAAAIGILTVHALTFYSFSVFLRPVTLALKWDRAAFSGALSVSWAVSAPLSVLAGRLCDKYGPRLLLTASGILIGAGFLLMLLVRSLWQVYLVYGIVLATGASACIVPVTSTVPRWFVKKRGMAVGLTWTGIGLGGVIAPLLAQWLIDVSNQNWRFAYAVLGGLNIVLLVPLAQMMKRSPEQMGMKPYGGENSPADPTSAPQTTGVSLKQATRSGQFWIAGLVFFCFFFIADSIMAHLAAHARDIEIPATIAASIVSIYAATSLIGRNLCGVITDRIGSRRTAIFAFLLITLTLILLLFAKQPWLFYTFAVLYGVFFGIAVPLQTILPGELFGMRSLGTISAGLMLIGTVGSVAGVPLAGAIYDSTHSYRNDFIILIGLGTMATLLSLLLPMAGRRKAQP